MALAVIAAVFIVPALPGAVLSAGGAAEAFRTIEPQLVEVGEEVEVTVAVQNLLDEPKAFALKEEIPQGWGFTRGVDNASDFRPGPPPEWVWFTIDAGETRTVTYTLSVPVDAEPGIYGIAGTVLGAGTHNPVGGQTAIAVGIELYSVTLVADPPGAAHLFAGQGLYQAGQNVTIEMVEAADDFDFVDWTSVPAVAFAEAAAQETTFTMPAQDVTVTARFEPETVPPFDDDDPVNTVAIVVTLVVLAAVIAVAAIIVRRRRARS